MDLFSEFGPSDFSAWKSRVTNELKGASLESLVWKNENGFDVIPYFTAEHLQSDYLPAFSHNDWAVSFWSPAGDAKSVNAQLLYALKRGADAIGFRSIGNPEVLIDSIQLNILHTSIFYDQHSLEDISAALQKSYPSEQLQGCLIAENVIGKDSFKKTAEVVERHDVLKNTKWLGADTFHYGNSGCYAYYDLALTIAQLVEALESGITYNNPFYVRTAVSADFFTELARLRAIRRLWALIAKEYGASNQLYVIGETTQSNKSVADPYNNLVRSTMEAMAAVAGGCNEVVVAGFDVASQPANNFSIRLAVNQQLVLKHECYMDKYADLGCGSYFIESLTDQLAARALEEVKKIERLGGYFSALASGEIKKLVGEHAKAKSSKIRSGETILIGVNKFRNEKEKIDWSSLGIHTPGFLSEYEREMAGAKSNA